MLKHNEKVLSHQRRLASFSKMLLFAGVGLASFAMFCFMTQTTAKAGQHKLGASKESSESLPAMFNGLSVVIWSMIAAKAKSGMNAAENGQLKTVSSYLQQAGSLILMIAVASGFNIYAQMDQVEFKADPVLMPAQHSLRASSSSVKDSHYKGGVASAAFEHFATLEADDFKFESSTAEKTLKETS